MISHALTLEGCREKTSVQEGRHEWKDFGNYWYKSISSIHYSISD